MILFLSMVLLIYFLGLIGKCYWFVLDVDEVNQLK